jgi:hypothetical protein
MWNACSAGDLWNVDCYYPLLVNFYLIMSYQTEYLRVFYHLAFLLVLGACPLFGADGKRLPGHVLGITRTLLAKGDLPATNEIQLSLGLPLRDAAGLKDFLAQVYDPHSPYFRQYLTPEEFTERFGPTAQAYEAVKSFARANGLRITGEHGNRLVLDVTGPVAKVEQAFQLKLRRFKHPTEARDFFAPDVEPLVATNLALADVSGLSDFKRPQPKLVKPKTISARVLPKSGSAPNGDFIGNDFRAAYVPGTTLTGAGQQVGLLQFDGFYASDIADYRTTAGLAAIPIQTVLVGNYNGTPTASGNGEVALDIEMAMAMAPGLDKIVIFTGGIKGSPNSILSRMASSNMVKNLSCSWGWGGGPTTTTDNIFKQMAAQGQSFFNASGDSGAFTTGVTSMNAVDDPGQANMPSSSPYITQVGGTTLQTTGPGGSWSSETVWNWGGGSGSSGGISSYYAIPDWQTNVNFISNQGSSTKRNIPDVALTADNIYYTHDNGQAGSVGGTSCSAPLWAGFMALVNERRASLGQPPAGLINQAVYNLGAGSSYAETFHDITSGDNTWSSSPDLFYAVTGYDLCSGWGTPAGTNLIDALGGQSIQNSLGILSATDFKASGPKGGYFNPNPSVITLTNSGADPVTWGLLNSNAATWLKISPVGGTLAGGETTNLILSYTSATTNLAVGNFTASLRFTNRTSFAGETVVFTLQVLPILSVTPTNGFIANGAVGGPFNPPSMDLVIQNLGTNSATWKINKLPKWLSALATTGAVESLGGNSVISLALNTNANQLKAGIYSATVTVVDAKNKAIQTLPFGLRIGQNLVVNGGFETGSFTGWTLAAANTSVSGTKGLYHTGKRGAALGNTTMLGYLSQTLSTTIGQTYLLSFWLTNPQSTRGATPNQFTVQWEGTTVYDQSNLPFTNWFNPQFTVTATQTNSLLKFGFRHDPYYLALDDVGVKPVAAPQLNFIARSVVVTAPSQIHFTFAVTSGLKYQAQYKTDLQQSDWMNLGAPVTATSEMLTISDADTADYSQKFYRLLQVP